jgi:hypothetical protein
MPTATINVSASVAGLSIQSSITRTATGNGGQEVSVAAAKTGTLSTRTDDNTGVVTLAADHGIVSADVVDVYWSGGLRYGMTATVVSNDATLDGGAGTALPAQGTAVTVCKQTTLDCDFDGDKLEAIVVSANKRCSVVFEDSTNAVLKALEIVNEPWTWAADTGIAAQITGNPVDEVKVSNGDSTAAAAIKIAYIYNSDT